MRHIPDKKSADWKARTREQDKKRSALRSKAYIRQIIGSTKCTKSWIMTPASCDRMCLQVSAVTQEGFDDLLEMLLLQAEIMELQVDEKVSKQAMFHCTALYCTGFVYVLPSLLFCVHWNAMPYCFLRQLCTIDLYVPLVKQQA